MNCEVKCRESEYKCPATDDSNNITICVDLFKVCDHFPDCIGGADERSGCRKFL